MNLMIINQDSDRVFNLNSIKQIFLSNAGILCKEAGKRYPEEMASYGYVAQAEYAFNDLLKAINNAQSNMSEMLVYKFPLQEEVEEMFPLPSEPMVGGAL